MISPSDCSLVFFEFSEGEFMRRVVRELPSFRKQDLKTVERAHAEAENLVSSFYVLAPREREQMHYEMRTLASLAPEEITNSAFAEVRCYDFVRHIGTQLIDRHDLYRICVQDHRILKAMHFAPVDERLLLEPLMLYILTHELVHVVRFSQQMQSINLTPTLREQEELSVEQTTQRILAPIADQALRRVIEKFEGH